MVTNQGITWTFFTNSDLLWCDINSNSVWDRPRSYVQTRDLEPLTYLWVNEVLQPAPEIQIAGSTATLFLLPQKMGQMKHSLYSPVVRCRV